MISKRKLNDSYSLEAGPPSGVVVTTLLLDKDQKNNKCRPNLLSMTLQEPDQFLTG
jgi:hypothetical protein